MSYLSDDYVKFEGVAKTYGAVKALDDVNLALPEGKLVCFLGPSGSGKTTLLRVLAGLESPSDGSVLVAGEDVTRQPVHRRNIGMVFQSLALFQHLSVGENIAYALRIRGVDKATRMRRAEELLDLVRLPGLADRQVSQLSGGQRQRVAIARALAVDPKLFLLDEPLSALDAKLREAMQVEFRQLQKRLNVTTIVVTHDQREAMTMADSVVVLDGGRVQQVGPPIEVYRNPANRFVADFIGANNLIAAKILGPGRASALNCEIRLEDDATSSNAGREVAIALRRESVRIEPQDSRGENRIPGEIRFVRDLGFEIEIHVEIGDTMIVGLMNHFSDNRLQAGGRVAVHLPASECVVLAT